MKNAVSLAGLAIVLAVSLAADMSFAQQKDALDSVRQSFEKKEQALLVEYGGALESTMVGLKKDGNLDAYLLVETEKKRFDTDKSVPFPDDANASFRPAVESYHKAKADLLRKYGVALEALVKKLMQADKIEDAKAVKAEKEKIAFVLADLETKLPKPVAVVEKKDTPAPSKPRKTEMTLTTSQMDRGKWKTSRLTVVQGAQVNVRVKPGVSMKKTGSDNYMHEALRVRIGDTGQEHLFDTSGRYNWQLPGRDWQYEAALTYTADVAGEVYVAHFQDLTVKVAISVDP